MQTLGFKNIFGNVEAKLKFWAPCLKSAAILSEFCQRSAVVSVGKTATSYLLAYDISDQRRCCCTLFAFRKGSSIMQKKNTVILIFSVPS